MKVEAAKIKKVSTAKVSSSNAGKTLSSTAQKTVRISQKFLCQYCLTFGPIYLNSYVSLLYIQQYCDRYVNVRRSFMLMTLQKLDTVTAKNRLSERKASVLDNMPRFGFNSNVYHDLHALMFLSKSFVPVW